MSLREVSIKGIYRTATDSLVRDFYLPCLAQANRYDRAVGFFSSSMLVEAATGLSGLILNQGRMRLLIGHELSDDDWAAVKDGTRLAAIQSSLIEELASILERAGTERSVHAFELLSWMVATNSIELRFAFRKSGMYHEKIGIISDSESNRIVFHGSANESAAALLPTRNFESLAVYRSWDQDVFAEYGEPFSAGFESLWNNETADVCTVPIPSQMYEELIKFRKGIHGPPDLTLEAALSDQLFQSMNASCVPNLPRLFAGHPYVLKEHQQKALAQWAANGYCGIFALATGSGKTVTALHAATRFVDQKYPIALVIAVPYQILGEQWAEVMEYFGMCPIRAFYSRENWANRLDDAISAFVAGATQFIAVVVVNDTLSSQDFQNRLNRLSSDKLFFVGDECHHHASFPWVDRIPVRAKFRIGMSATPWDPGRDLQKATLERLYGPVVAIYTLREAVNDGVLCKYSYHWIPCEFDDDEAEEYERLSKQITVLYAQDPTFTNPSIQTQLQSLTSRRTRLVGALRDKIRQLKHLLKQRPVSSHTLFYCGEGQHPLENNHQDVERLVDDTISGVASFGWKIGRITAAESQRQRQEVLSGFDDGLIDAIAAIRVLDEGFDIPSCRTAYILASSNSYRQYVQRRGRVLRRAPGKDSADIYDFVALPSTTLLGKNNKLWRRQVATELGRIRDFVSLASNEYSQRLQINNRMDQLGLGAIYYEALPVSEEIDYGD